MAPPFGTAPPLASPRAKEYRLALIFQILVVLALLTGLVTIFLTTKIWHWTQVTLVTFVMLFGILALFLSAEVFRIHRNLRSAIPKNERNLALQEQRKQELLEGTGDKPGIRQMEHRLRLVTRQRGRVWRQVQPTSDNGPNGEVTVSIGDPQPHGLTKDAIVYVFESGDPTQGAEYLGDFRVIAVTADGVTLEPILLMPLYPRAAERLANSNGPWSFYETMPADRHNLYKDLTEEQILELFRDLPEEVVQQYVRHGKEADNDDDPLDIIHLDEKGDRVDPDAEELVVKKIYDRPLRDYAYIFGEFARQKTVLVAEMEAVAEDNAKIQAALASARKLNQFRKQEKADRQIDLEAMQLEQQTVEAHRDQLMRGLSVARQRIDSLLSENSSLARKLRRTQMALIEFIDASSPAPAGTGTPAAP